ncbi:MAG: DUF4990 domain-containing protein [Bacteroidales bacterium]|nr:DUF4990 domain-containing protein [Bacteroidales bacterium]
MKNTLAILLLTLSLSVSGATFYISTNGSDSNPGTESKPFFTLNKAWSVVSAGDIIYMRGGTYYYTSQQRLLGKNGNSGNLIKVWAYPGEKPVITRADSWSWTDFRAGVHFSGDYCHFKGIQIEGFDQRDEFVWTALRCEDFNNCIFEFIECSWSGLGSYMTGSCDDNVFLNCDWHDNWDPRSKYENADGLNFEVVKAGGSNTFRGCRFWNNSDDGFDAYNNDSYLLIENCWAWHQGYREDGSTVGGDGNGFKLGPTSISASSTILRKIVNCISYKNQAWGFNENGSTLCNMEVYNNISYNNSFGSNWGGGFHFNVSGVAYYVKNNISYQDVPDAADIGVETHVENNSWDGSYTVTSSDFVSLDGSELALPRKSDGSLPDINFLRLAEGSDMIDAGVNVGLSYSGAGPDLGPYEYEDGTVVIPVPNFISASVANASPTLLSMSYDLALNNKIVPAASSFVVSVNSQSRTINSFSVADKKVTLTISSAVKYGDVITLSYTKPSTNPLQTSSGGQVESFSGKSVTNNTLAPVNIAPTTVITSPKSNSSYIAPASITITATASDADGTVSLVEFYNGTTRIGSKSSAPYTFTWSNVAKGTYTINTVATDNKGAKTASKAITVLVSTVAPPPVENLSPTATISSPTKGYKFEEPADIEIEVIASDPDGTISKVELFNGDVMIAQLTKAPYTYIWKGVSAGQYAIKAIATDNLNLASPPSLVEFNVSEKPVYDAKSEIINLYPNPNNGQFNIEFLVPLENARNEIVISDLSGNQVYREVVSSEETSKEFDLPYIRSGVYILMVVSKEIIVTKKLIKK